MSSKASRRPVFRLTLGYPILTIEAEPANADLAGAPDDHSALTEIDLSKSGAGRQLRALSVAVRRAHGRLRVVLPASEVWRGLVPAGSDPLAEARRRAAAALGQTAGTLVLVSAPPTTAGDIPVAAASRAVLIDARAFLRRHGLRPASFVGAGAFDGFAERPRFAAGVMPTLPGLGPLAGFARAARPRLPGIADLLPGWPPTGAFVAGSALALACAAVALVAGLAPEHARLASVEPPAVAEVAPRALAVSPAPFPPRVLAQAGPPVTPVEHLRPRKAERDTRLAMSAPAPARPAVSRPVSAQPIMAIATRDMPELRGLRDVRDLDATRVAQLVAAPMRRSDAGPARPPVAAVSAPAPKPRPGPVATAAAPAAILDENGAILRPTPRPGGRAGGAPVQAAAITAAVSAAAGDPSRPRPRAGRAAPLSPAITAAVERADPVRVASLEPATRSTSDLVAAALAQAPEPRPTPPRAAVPGVAAPAAAFAPAPASARQVAIAPAGDIARPAAQPQRVAIAQPQAQAVRTVQPARVQPTRAQPSAQRATTATRRLGAAGAAKAVENTGFSRGGLSLLGVFGTKTARHALIRLPDGAVTRVRAGDTVQGAQVASVSADSVRLTGSGRDMILKLK